MIRCEKTGDVSPRCRRFFRAHKQLKDVFTNNIMFVQAGVLFAQSVKALNTAVLVNNHNHRIGF